MKARQHGYVPFQPILTPEGLRYSRLMAQQTGPSPWLQTKVHSYLQIQVSQPTPYHIFPDGTQALFISRDNSRLSGPLRMACSVPLFEPGDYFGIRFYPGVIRRFFDMDLAQSTGEFMDQGDLPGIDLDRLQQQIYQQDHFFARVAVCEEWLRLHFKPGLVSGFDNILQTSYRSAGNIRVSVLADIVGLSERHLNRQFRYHTGLTTKAFLQVLRLQRFYRQRYLQSEHVASLALNSGYYDQAHSLKAARHYVPRDQRVFFDLIVSDFSNP